MNRSVTIAALIVVVVAVGALLYLKRDTVSEPAVNTGDTSSTTEPNGSVSSETDSAVRSVVTEFGSRLKNVSLLQPKATLGPNMAAEYGAYLEPALLKAWQDDPTKALGRQTSSPWPDRINIVNVTKVNENTYRVDGNLIEITSDTQSNPAAITPLTLTLRRSDNSWLISSVLKGISSNPPQRVTVTGRWICLPHRDTSGPQTMECAFGVKLDDDTGNLAVNTSLMSTYPIDFPTDTHIRVEGVMVPAEQLNTDMWQRYNIKGIVSATSITKI